MREIVEIDVWEIVPETADLLAAQGMGSAAAPGDAAVAGSGDAAGAGSGDAAAAGSDAAGASSGGAAGAERQAATGPSERTEALCREALALFAEQARPIGILRELSGSEFAQVHAGDGENADRTPLGEIFPRAESLALFAVTVGAAVSDKISALFAARDFALASLLDAAASEGAERAGDAIERRWLELLAASGEAREDTRLLRYSPGYCGWQVSGQRALFASLRPGEIGITLRESCLMEPLKSLSGVIVAGPGEIHAFKADYDFCDDCETRSCRRRIRRVLA